MKTFKDKTEEFDYNIEVTNINMFTDVRFIDKVKETSRPLMEFIYKNIIFSADDDIKESVDKILEKLPIGTVKIESNNFKIKYSNHINLSFDISILAINRLNKIKKILNKNG